MDEELLKKFARELMDSVEYDAEYKKFAKHAYKALQTLMSVGFTREESFQFLLKSLK